MPPSEQMKHKKNNFMIDEDDFEDQEAARRFNTALGSHSSKGASNATLTTKASRNGFAANIEDEDDEDSKGPVNDESSSNLLFHPPAAHEERSDGSINEDINFAMESTVASNV